MQPIDAAYSPLAIFVRWGVMIMPRVNCQNLPQSRPMDARFRAQSKDITWVETAMCKSWKCRCGVITIAGVLVALFLLNASWMAEPPSGRPRIVAQRGFAQAYALSEVTDDTCTARLITPPTHGFIDNTLSSIGAALAAEADIVEIDVRTTKD